MTNELLERLKAMKGDEHCPTPLEYWLGVLWSPDEPQDRHDKAAEILMPFMHPRLAAVALKSMDDDKVTIEIRDFRKERPAISHQPAVQIAEVIDVTDDDPEPMMSDLTGDRLDSGS